MRMNRKLRNSPQRLAVVDVGGDLGGQLQALPHLLAQEAVAHEVAGLDAEGLALVALGLAQLRVVVAQRQPPEHDVARLVLHHVGVQRLGQRVLWRCCG